MVIWKLLLVLCVLLVSWSNAQENQVCDVSQSSDNCRIASFDRVNMIKVGDAKVGYYKAGSGPPLVLIHGFPLSGRTWRKVVPLLSQAFTCYAFDVIGFGNSTSTNDFHYSSVGQAKVFFEALKLLKIGDSYSLMGNDSGGWISRELALLNTSAVKRFVLTNTEIPDHRPPFIPQYGLLAHVPFVDIPFKHLLRWPLFTHSSAAFGSCFKNLSLIDGEFTELFLNRLTKDTSTSLGGDRLKELMRFLKYMDFKRVDGFKTAGHNLLTMPVLLLWGDADRTFPVQRAREMATQFPNAKFDVIPGGYLFMHEEEPFATQTAKAAMDFLLSSS